MSNTKHIKKQYFKLVMDESVLWEGFIDDCQQSVQRINVPKMETYVAAVDYWKQGDAIPDTTVQYDTIEHVTLTLTSWLDDHYPIVDKLDKPEETTAELLEKQHLKDSTELVYEKTLPEERLKVAELLEKAAEILERDEWVRGHFHKTVRRRVVRDEGVTIR